MSTRGRGEEKLDIPETVCASYPPANVDFVEASAEELPFADNSFDASTISFGIRNVLHIDVALTEAFRVLERGGRLLADGSFALAVAWMG
jgi:ubiquinone/menaquinone biosynthesis C-methylase UbiE